MKKTTKRRVRIVPRSVLFAGMTGAAVVPILVGCHSGSATSSSGTSGTSSGTMLGVANNICDTNPTDFRCLGVGAPPFCDTNPNDPSCKDSGADAPRDGGDGGDASDGGDGEAG